MNEKISTKLAFITSNSLLETAEFLLANIDESNIFKSPNRMAFILSIAAFMEAKLNESILHWGEILSPIESGVMHAKSFLTMNLRAKLDTIFFIYSNGDYVTNTGSKEYQALANLVSIRNQIAHLKPFIAELDIDYVDNEDGSKGFTLPKEIIEKSNLKVNELTIEDLKYLVYAAKVLIKALDYEESYKISPICKKIKI